MGSLAHFAPWLHNGLRRYGFASFVETGTARGDSLAIAARLPFKALHSIEIVPDLAAAARVRFKDDARVQVWEGDSLDCLPMILRDLPAEPCLFWLDAHFPGAHTGADYAAEPSVERRLPLGREVELIRQARPGAGAEEARAFRGELLGLRPQGRHLEPVGADPAGGRDDDDGDLDGRLQAGGPEAWHRPLDGQGHDRESGDEDGLAATAEREVPRMGSVAARRRPPRRRQGAD
jgi:hypothetical protein